jgi:hypothetical protein
MPLRGPFQYNYGKISVRNFQLTAYLEQHGLIVNRIEKGKFLVKEIVDQEGVVFQIPPQATVFTLAKPSDKPKVRFISWLFLLD